MYMIMHENAVFRVKLSGETEMDAAHSGASPLWK